MDFNKIEAEERHIFKLWTLCRVCGQAGDKLQYCLDNYSELLEALYSIDLNNDDPAIHPQMVCQKCRLVLQHYLKRGSKATKDQQKLPELPQLYIFKKHNDECDVCDRASGLLPKRKMSEEPNEMLKPGKVMRPTNYPADIGDLSIVHAVVQGGENSADQGESMQVAERDNVLLQAIQGAIGEEAMMENPEATLDKPDEEGFTKYVYLNMIRRFKARGVTEDKVNDSINVERFRQKNFASSFLACSLCKRLPLKPVTTECKHVFCESCISDWLNFGNVCPKCEEVIIELSDATDQLSHLYMLLDTSCSFAGEGCDAKLAPLEILNHEKDCPYNDKIVNATETSDEEDGRVEECAEPAKTIRTSLRKKRNLSLVTARQAAARMEELTDMFNRACVKNREDNIDALFYMLKQALSSSNDTRAAAVYMLWRNRKKRVELKKTKRPTSNPSPYRKGVPRKRGRPRKVFAKSTLEHSDEVGGARSQIVDSQSKPQSSDDSQTATKSGNDDDCLVNVGVEGSG